MTQGYTFLEDIAISDLAFEARGDTPAELFQAAALALFEGMADTHRLRPKIRKEIRLRHAQLDQLMYDWLSELIYLKDKEGLLFKEFTVRLDHNSEWSLMASVGGEPIDPKRHGLRADAKAVTYHRFEVAQTEAGGWKALVVVDI
ncbi:MAG TPA: archease [Nitrospiria bacterium]|jgi:SHS2 domain-containing protein|nr:archease [Nitrospiria bacterium]